MGLVAQAAWCEGNGAQCRAAQSGEHRVASPRRATVTTRPLTAVPGELLGPLLLQGPLLGHDTAFSRALDIPGPRDPLSNLHGRGRDKDQWPHLTEGETEAQRRPYSPSKLGASTQPPDPRLGHSVPGCCRVPGAGSREPDQLHFPLFRQWSFKRPRTLIESEARNSRQLRWLQFISADIY